VDTERGTVEDIVVVVVGNTAVVVVGSHLGWGSVEVEVGTGSGGSQVEHLIPRLSLGRDNSTW